jgi:hypothetical protein
MSEPSRSARRKDPDGLHLDREEAELLGVELRHQTRTDERRYPHEHPEPAITEEALVRDLAGDGQDEQREDVEEAFSDAQDRVGTDDDPDTPRE